MVGQYASPPVLCCGDLSLCRSSICRRYLRVIGALTAVNTKLTTHGIAVAVLWDNAMRGIADG